MINIVKAPKLEVNVLYVPYSVHIVDMSWNVYV